MFYSLYIPLIFIKIIFYPSVIHTITINRMINHPEPFPTNVLISSTTSISFLKSFFESMICFGSTIKRQKIIRIDHYPDYGLTPILLKTSWVRSNGRRPFCNQHW